MTRSAREPFTIPTPRAAAGAVLALAIGLGACANDDASPYFGTTVRRGKDPATFYVNNASEPEYLDPGRCHDGGSGVLVMHLFEGLTTFHPKDGHPVQAVAERWEVSDDNRLFRFHLRPDARWSDGKPVTAGDFAYAWKRVLRPSLASQAAPHLHVLFNGELYNLGRLRALGRDATLLGAARPDAPESGRLPKGAPVRILGRSPLRVKTAVAPLPEPPPGVGLVALGKDDRLAFGGAHPVIAPSSDGAWKGADVEVLDQGPPVDCEDVHDHWFRIKRGDQQGWLPGCALGPAKGAKTWALVERHDRLPTYGRRVVAPEGKPPKGYVEEEALVEDDSAVGVRARDDLTLEVELERSIPYFTDLTSNWTMYPVRRDVVERFEQRGEPELWFRPENIVVNGPYTLDTWKFQYEITMKVNPFYWNREKLKIKRIVWLEVEDYHATMNLYKAGEIDYIGDNLSPPPEYVPVIEKKKDFQRNDYLAIYWFELNTRKPPLDDIRVRRALSFAIDRRQIIDKVTHGGQTPATHYVPEFTGSGYSDEVARERAAGTDPFAEPKDGLDPARAQKLLAEAGFAVQKDGEGLRADKFPALEILYNTSEGHKQIAVAIQDMWKRHLGISATLRNEEWRVMLKTYREGNYQVIRFGQIAEFNHPHSFLEPFTAKNPQNVTGWGDPAFDDALRAAAASSDPVESIRLYRKAEKLAVDGMARIPLYFYKRQNLVKPWVRGFWGSRLSPHLVQWLWIDPDWEKGENKPAYKPPEPPPPARFVP